MVILAKMMKGVNMRQNGCVANRKRSRMKNDDAKGCKGCDDDVETVVTKSLFACTYCPLSLSSDWKSDWLRILFIAYCNVADCHLFYNKYKQNDRLNARTIGRGASPI